MAADVSLTPAIAPADAVDPRARRGHRLAVSASGAAAVVMSYLLAIGLWTQDRYYLELSLGAGVAALAAGVGYHAWASRARAADAPQEPPRIFAAGARTSPPAVAAAGTVGRPDPTTPQSGIGQATVQGAAEGGPRIWQQWDAPTPWSKTLGSPLIGPVPETAYVPHAPGAFVPFPSTEQDIVYVPGAVLRPLPVASPWALDRFPSDPHRSGAVRGHSGGRARSARGGRTEPFSDRELDELFPPGPPRPEGGAAGAIAPAIPSMTGPGPSCALALRTPPVIGAAGPRRLSPAPARSPGGPPSIPGPRPGSTRPSATAEASAAAAPVRHAIYLEAINPIPPHRRESERRSPGERPAPPFRSPDTLRSCAVCDRGLSDFRSWAECAKCYRPVCRLCLSISLLSGYDGLCSTCRPGPTPAAG